MTFIRTILLIAFVISASAGFAQVDSSSVIYGSFKVRKTQNSCIPPHLIDKVKVSDVNAQSVRKKGSLRGAVLVKGSSRQTIPEAFVAAYLGDSLVAYTLANADGMYRFYDLPPNLYRIEVCRLGYEGSTMDGVVIKSNNITFLDVTLDRTYQTYSPTDTFPKENIGTFRIRHRDTKTVEAPGSIRGSITLVNNKFPLDKVVVELYQNGEKVATADCSTKGQFSFGKLENGTYDVNIITDRNNNDMIPGVKVNTGKIKMIEVKLTRKGKIKSGR